MKRISHQIPFTSLILENMAVVLAHVFSKVPLYHWLCENTKSGWVSLTMLKTEQRANRAILELATQLRIMDDREDLSGLVRDSFGKVIKDNAKDEPLFFRDMTNKIMHSKGLEWNLAERDNPILICHSRDTTRWLRAEVSLSRLASFCCDTLLSDAHFQRVLALNERENAVAATKIEKGE